jgi:uncharacterized NAD(P)/FAD-binding protein YdhS
MGRGVAYSTTEPTHLLNVPAEGMSALAGNLDHFADRFEAEGGDRWGFAQRRFFARYLSEILDDAVDTGHVDLLHCTAESAEASDGGWRIRFNDGSSLEAGAVVLAIGNQEPASLPSFAAAGERYIANPWGGDAGAAVQDVAIKGGDVLLIGTGLTMIDIVLSLDAAGHSGGILALSRRGQMPRGHSDYDPAPVEAGAVPFGSVRAVWRWLRRRSAEIGWRAAVDSLRPHSHALWQSLGVVEQRRFLRHARPWWDVHRHRIAPEVAGAIARLIGEGRLQVMAGRVVAASPVTGGIEVEVCRRGSEAPQRRTFVYVFNCTGPLHSIERTRDPLLRSLIEAGEVRPDQLGIGVAVDENARAGERLWALGPLTKGRYWEIIAVPDIREQAASVANDIARELNK